MIVVRPAADDDLEGIRRIYNHAIVNTTATFDMEPKTIEDRRRWLHERPENCPVIVAVEGGEIVGWAELKRYGTRRAYRYTTENAVYVDCDHQSRGIGSALLGRLVELARDNGYHAILALIVGGNESSVRLHERLGFERTGVLREVGRKFGRWLDVLVLEKMLECTPVD